MDNLGYQNQLEIIYKAGYKDYFEYWKQEIGLDPYKEGKWYKDYSDALNKIFLLNNKIILDVGCAGGLTVKSLGKYTEEVYGCDVNLNVIKNSPFNLPKLSVCDTQILHPFNDNYFDFITSHMVFEHLPTWDYTINTMQAIYRVLKFGGLFFCVLATHTIHLELDDLFKMRELNIPMDVTHVNLWPMKKWKECADISEFVDVSNIFCPIMDCYITTDNFSYFENYSWDMFCFCKVFDIESLLEKAITGLHRILSAQEIYVPKQLRKMVYYKILWNREIHPKIRKIIKSYIPE